MPFGRIVEVTFVLIIAYLILTNAFGASSLIRAAGQTYTDSIKALQGR